MHNLKKHQLYSNTKKTQNNHFTFYKEYLCVLLPTNWQIAKGHISVLSNKRPNQSGNSQFSNLIKMLTFNIFGNARI